MYFTTTKNGIQETQSQEPQLSLANYLHSTSLSLPSFKVIEYKGRGALYRGRWFFRFYV